MPRLVTMFWYLILLIWYYLSKDEPFWLAIFLLTTDGFMGFLGLYTVTLQLIPGLPSIELVQFYIILMTIKALGIKKRSFVFYKKYLALLLFYLAFLIVWGQMMGFNQELKGYFRVLKLTLPLLLFYSVPCLFSEIGTYNRLFSFIFLVLIAAFFTQLFTLITGFSPSGTLELTEEQISEAGAYRGFYNISVTLLGLFGSLFYLSINKNTIFNPLYLLFVVFSAFGMVLLSATRGWILGFGFIILLAILITQNIRIKFRISVAIIALVILMSGLSSSKIKEQIQFSFERLATLEELTQGDVTAEGTLLRLDVRGPRVMKKFMENPIFGWGFSDITREYSDGHVANQTILMTSGIIGFSLFIGFLVYFSLKLFIAFKRSSGYSQYKYGFLFFIIFLTGWFFIHSTSGQQFNFMGIPDQIIPQAVFFSFGALIYNETYKRPYLS